jgi:hypothetical protein
MISVETMTIPTLSVPKTKSVQTQTDHPRVKTEDFTNPLTNATNNYMKLSDLYLKHSKLRDSTANENNAPVTSLHSRLLSKRKV